MTSTCVILHDIVYLISNLFSSFHDGCHLFVVHLALFVDILLILQWLCVYSVVIVHDFASLLPIMLFFCLSLCFVLPLLLLSVVIFLSLLQSIILFLLPQLFLIVFFLGDFDLFCPGYGIDSCLIFLDSFVNLTVDTSFLCFVGNLFDMVLLALFILIFHCLYVFVDDLFAFGVVEIVILVDEVHLLSLFVVGDILDDMVVVLADCVSLAVCYDVVLVLNFRLFLLVLL